MHELMIYLNLGIADETIIPKPKLLTEPYRYYEPNVATVSLSVLTHIIQHYVDIYDIHVKNQKAKLDQKRDDGTGVDDNAIDTTINVHDTPDEGLFMRTSSEEYRILLDLLRPFGLASDLNKTIRLVRTKYTRSRYYVDYNEDCRYEPYGILSAALLFAPKLARALIQEPTIDLSSGTETIERSQFAESGTNGGANGVTISANDVIRCDRATLCIAIERCFYNDDAFDLLQHILRHCSTILLNPMLCDDNPILKIVNMVYHLRIAFNVSTLQTRKEELYQNAEKCMQYVLEQYTADLSRGNLTIAPKSSWLGGHDVLSSVDFTFGFRSFQGSVNRRLMRGEFDGYEDEDELEYLKCKHKIREQIRHKVISNAQEWTRRTTEIVDEILHFPKEITSLVINYL
jgi:hypothetical protein